MCEEFFFAHIGYAVALTANRNKIAFHLLKSLFKTEEKNLHFFTFVFFGNSKHLPNFFLQQFYIHNVF